LAGIYSPPLEGWQAKPDGVVMNCDKPIENRSLQNHPAPTGHPSTGGESGGQLLRFGQMRKTKQYLSLPYNPKLKARARELRKAGNLAEVLLWKLLKNKQFQGLDFDRQKIIGNFIVDFYCAEKSVVIEVDGSSHDNKVEYDAQRDAFLEGLDLKVIHFLDTDVRTNLERVMQMLAAHEAMKSNSCYE
jgi:very-short-patch-repair endonuclease